VIIAMFVVGINPVKVKLICW